jgi:predicted adenylyl cyclase CyaB
MRNVEIKARIPSVPGLLAMMKPLGAEGPVDVMRQTDTYFSAAAGRLKLREINSAGGARGELIFYRRPDRRGPKLSEYEILEFADTTGLKKLLSAALGVLAVVRKERTLYRIGITRIHLDQVERLGNFVELEVVLPQDATVEMGESTARQIMHNLKIEDADLVDRSYLDLVLEAR